MKSSTLEAGRRSKSKWPVPTASWDGRLCRRVRVPGGMRRLSFATPRTGGMAVWGVRRAVAHVNGEIASAIQGMDLEDQTGIDAALVALDGTPNKGGSAPTRSSVFPWPSAHAAAAARGEPLYVHLNRLWRNRLEPGEFAEPVLPMPMVNMISGGLHAGANLDFQDFLMIPVGATSYSKLLEMTTAIYRAVGAVLAEKDMEGVLVGDEGGYGPKLATNAQAVDLILEAVLACGMEPGRDVAIAA